MTISSRNHNGETHGFVSPWGELNGGLWSLFAGATVFLGLRIWCKITRRYGLWYDDYILVLSWLVLLANNTLIVWQFGNGYVYKDSSQSWDDHMRILINVSSCGTLMGQAWTKTAFGVTLLRISNTWQRWVLGFCIVTMNIFMITKLFLQWGQICDKDGYQNSWRLNFCVNWDFRENFKEGGNVYNIIMDFVFATFPWLITRRLEMRSAEKVGLCITMSLGMIVAIVSAIRVAWKDEGNKKDEWYFVRQALSQVWYSSEITGTIIVQCIPILRPMVREIATTLTSTRLHDTDTQLRISWTSRLSGSRRSTFNPPHEVVGVRGADGIALHNIPEERPYEECKQVHTSQNVRYDADRKSSLKAPSEITWTDDDMPEMRKSHSHRSSKSLGRDPHARGHSFTSFDDVESQTGLSPPPRRFHGRDMKSYD